MSITKSTSGKLVSTSDRLLRQVINSNWPLIVGLILLLPPCALIWRHLGSHFAGGDGKMFLDIIETYQHFGPWLQLIIHNPLEGLWNISIPMNVWAEPGLWPFLFMSVRQAQIWSGSIC